MSGSFQVLKTVERLFLMSEPSLIETKDDLADRIWWRDWRVEGSLLLKACLLLVVWTTETSRL